MKNKFFIGPYIAIIFSLVILFYFAEITDSKTNYMKKQFLSSGINLDYMDTTISPRNDFYKYVNGNWLDSATIPNDHSVWGGFYELRKKTDADVLEILESALHDNTISSDSDQGKVVAMYECFMDLEHRNKKGIDPILPYLDKVNTITDVATLQNYMEEESAHGGGSDFFGIYIGVDKKNSNTHSAYLYGGTLGLPDRDYYLLDSFEDIRLKYVSYIERMFQFMGYSQEDCQNYAKSILAFETKIAQAKMDKVTRRDPAKTYNPRSLSEVQDLLPMIDWRKYLVRPKKHSNLGFSLYYFTCNPIRRAHRTIHISRKF